MMLVAALVRHGPDLVHSSIGSIFKVIRKWAFALEAVGRPAAETVRKVTAIEFRLVFIHTAIFAGFADVEQLTLILGLHTPDQIHAKPLWPLIRIPCLGTVQQMQTPRLLEKLTNGRLRCLRQPHASNKLRLILRRPSTFRCHSGHHTRASLIRRVNRLLRLWRIPQIVYLVPVKGVSGLVDVPKVPPTSRRPTHQHLACRGRSGDRLCQH